MKPADEAGAGAGVVEDDVSLFGLHLPGADEELVDASLRCGGPNGLKPADDAGAGAAADGVHFAGPDDVLVSER